MKILHSIRTIIQGLTCVIWSTHGSHTCNLIQHSTWYSEYCWPVACHKISLKLVRCESIDSLITPTYPTAQTECKRNLPHEMVDNRNILVLAVKFNRFSERDGAWFSSRPSTAAMGTGLIHHRGGRTSKQLRRLVT